jgi:hypothetical protein
MSARSDADPDGDEPEDGKNELLDRVLNVLFTYLP